MPYCATCRMEYREHRDTCADCGATLVAGPMPSRPFQPEEWCVVLKARRRERADIVQGMLRSQGIECEIISKALSEMPVPAVGFSSYFECWIPREAEEDARRMIEEAEGVAPCRECGHLSAPDAPGCEYCEAPRPASPSTDA